MQLYVQLLGDFWQLPLDKWHAVCERGARGKPYDLAELQYKARKLAGKPHGIEARGGAFVTLSPGIILKQPLDWTTTDFARELGELDRLRDAAADELMKAG